DSHPPILHDSSFTVTGSSGGTVIIYCHYSTEDRSHEKYFCLGQNRLRCKDQIRTGLRNTWKHTGRFSVSDNRGERFYTVNISDLTEDDTGTYWCGVETSRTEQRYITLITQVKLLVISEKYVEKDIVFIGSHCVPLWFSCFISGPIVLNSGYETPKL
uniref:Ig-like domain-containing protein n=1 Tax=Oncorhynchus tshawytscha TaxID=74940 RepID=A0AAZ3P9H6_ONCTS